MSHVSEAWSQDSNLGLFGFNGQGLASKIKRQELANKWKTLEGNQTPRIWLTVVAEVQGWAGVLVFPVYSLVLF